MASVTDAGIYRNDPQGVRHWYNFLTTMECFLTERKVELMDLELKLEKMSFHFSLTGKIYEDCILLEVL